MIIDIPTPELSKQEEIMHFDIERRYRMGLHLAYYDYLAVDGYEAMQEAYNKNTVILKKYAESENKNYTPVDYNTWLKQEAELALKIEKQIEKIKLRASGLFLSVLLVGILLIWLLR